MIDETVGNYKADRTFTSVIKQKNSNGTYVILDESGGESGHIPNISIVSGKQNDTYDYDINGNHISVNDGMSPIFYV